MDLAFRGSSYSPGQRAAAGPRGVIHLRPGYARFRPIRFAPVYPLLGSYSIALPRPISIASIFSFILYFFLPLLVFPVYLEMFRLLYPRFSLLPRAIGGRMILRPPDQTIFFKEMSVLALAAIIVLILQAALALLFLKKMPWGEASLAPGLLSIGAYGVLRGFHALPSDTLLFPHPAAWISLGVWLLFSALILFPRLRPILRQN